jgi:hypothetical protein
MISNTRNLISWVEEIHSLQRELSHFLHFRYLRSRVNSIARRDAARARKKDKYALVKEEKEAAMVDRRKEFKEKEDKASDRICTPCSRYAER